MNRAKQGDRTSAPTGIAALTGGGVNDVIRSLLNVTQTIKDNVNDTGQPPDLNLASGSPGAFRAPPSSAPPAVKNLTAPPAPPPVAPPLGGAPGAYRPPPPPVKPLPNIKDSPSESKNNAKPPPKPPPPPRPGANNPNASTAS